MDKSVQYLVLMFSFSFVVRKKNALGTLQMAWRSLVNFQRIGLERLVSRRFLEFCFAVFTFLLPRFDA